MTTRLRLTLFAGTFLSLAFGLAACVGDSEPNRGVSLADLEPPCGTLDADGERGVSAPVRETVVNVGIQSQAFRDLHAKFATLKARPDTRDVYFAMRLTEPPSFEVTGWVDKPANEAELIRYMRSAGKTVLIATVHPTTPSEPYTTMNLSSFLQRRQRLEMTYAKIRQYVSPRIFYFEEGWMGNEFGAMTMADHVAGLTDLLDREAAFARFQIRHPQNGQLISINGVLVGDESAVAVRFEDLWDHGHTRMLAAPSPASASGRLTLHTMVVETSASVQLRIAPDGAGLVIDSNALDLGEAVALAKNELGIWALGKRYVSEFHHGGTQRVFVWTTNPDIDGYLDLPL